MTDDDALRLQLVAELALVEATVRDLGHDTTLDEQLPALAVDLGDTSDDRSEDGASGKRRSMVITIRRTDLFAADEQIVFTVVMPFDVPTDRADDVDEALPVVNAAIASGRFTRAGTTVAFEHSITVDTSATIDDEMLRALLPALVDEQERYGDYVEGVVADEISVAVLADVIDAAGD